MGNSHKKSLNLQSIPPHSSPQHVIERKEENGASMRKEENGVIMKGENNGTMGVTENGTTVKNENGTLVNMTVNGVNHSSSNADNKNMRNTLDNGVKSVTHSNSSASIKKVVSSFIPSDNVTQVTPNTDIDIPFPKRMHLTLAGPEIENHPMAVIGDVHGCLDELKELLAKIRCQYPDCLIIFAGDMINKGPKSLETLRYVRNMGNQAFAVRGNHEDHTLDRWLKWKLHGESMPKKKFAWSTELTQEEAMWIQELPYTITIPHTSSIIVHAGLVPGRKLQLQQPWDMTEMRDLLIYDGGRPSKIRNKERGVAWATCWNGPEHVYFGHDAKRRLQQHAHATGLDTGCVFGGQLTAHFLTGTKEMVRVDAKCAYKKAKTKKAGHDGDGHELTGYMSDDE